MARRAVRRRSVRTRLIAFVLAVTIPLVALLIVQSFYATSVVHARVAESNRNLLSVYLGQIEQNLTYVEFFLTSMVAYDVDLLSIESIGDADRYMLAKIRLFIKLSDAIPLHQGMDGFFVYVSNRDDFFEVYNSGLDLDRKERIRARLRGILGGPLPPDGESRKWVPVKIDGEFYLLQIAKTGATYIGAWVSAGRLLMPLGLIDLGDRGFTLLIAENGEPMASGERIAAEGIDLGRGFDRYYLTGRTTRYLVVGSSSQRGGFSLAAVIPNRQVIQNLPYLQVLAAGMSLAFIAIIPLGLLILRRLVLAPLQHLVGVMDGIREGDLALRTDPGAGSDEFSAVNDTFNRMIERIQKLKIDVYEEQLEAQRAELRGLQLQIKPHFYLNTLNVIYHLAEVRDFALIQEMTLSLVRYFRYVFRSDASFVSLRDELDHVRNYLRIQELRFADGHSCRIDAAEDCLGTPVPPLAVQTFVENSIKYGVTLDEPVGIRVAARRESGSRGALLKIEILDSGPGVSAETLAQLRSGDLKPDGEGARVGIWNIRRRLDLLYGGRASLEFFNEIPHGLRVELTLPVEA
jgi:two-component system sensor histidine kinase YesM